MISTRYRMRRRDEGAILIFAIIIVTVVAVVSAALMTRGSGSLRATVQLRSVAGGGYAADAAAQIAINAIRTGQDLPGGLPVEALGENRWAYNNASPGPGCFGNDASGPANTLTLDNFYTTPGSTAADTSAVVVCKPEQATGASGTATELTNTNKPINAILTLGTDDKDTIKFDSENRSRNRPLNIGGSVHSSTDIKVDDGYVLVDGNVSALTGCSEEDGGSIQVVAKPGNIKKCSGVPKGTDPNYVSGLNGVPELRTPPACPTSGRLVTLRPGYYADVEALNNLTDSSSCDDKVIWFQPGVYYFDFHNDNVDNRNCPNNNRKCAKHKEYGSQGRGDGYDPMAEGKLFTPMANVWEISRNKIVGGEPVAADGTLLPRDGSGDLIDTAWNPSFPGSCRSPIESPRAQGVTFVFGGSSRMHVMDGDEDKVPAIELCGTYRQPPVAGQSPVAPVVFYGLKSGDGAEARKKKELRAEDGEALRPLTTGNATVTNFPAPVTNDSLATSGSVLSFTRPDNNSNNTAAATVAVDGFATSNPLPKGAIITRMVAKVRHREGNSSGTAPNLNLNIKGFSGTSIGNWNAAIERKTSLATYDVDLSDTDVMSAADYKDVRRKIHDNGFSGAVLTYTVGAAKKEKVEVDSILLEIDYYLPTLRAQTKDTIPNNCLDQSSAEDCEVLETEDDYRGSLFFQGTVYAPLGAVEIEVKNNGLNNSGRIRSQAFLFGVISRTIEIDAEVENDERKKNRNNQVLTEFPVVSVPANTAGFGYTNTTVQLTVYVCQGGSGACTPTSPTARKSLVTRVNYYDPTGIPNPPNRQVSILGWSHFR